jgi:hypothetical protein
MARDRARKTRTAARHSRTPTATIQVTVNAAHLDDWWQGRTLAEKGEVFTNWLQVGRDEENIHRKHLWLAPAPWRT